MSFRVADIPLFKEYQFTDTGEVARHFGLVLLPEEATKYQGSVLCCVITSKKPNRWDLLLSKKDYSFFIMDSFVCFDRKDLVSKSGLDGGVQPRGRLNKKDFKRN